MHMKEISTQADWQDFIDAVDTINGVIVQGLDLSSDANSRQILQKLQPLQEKHHAIFLGCHFQDAVLERLYDVGALIFPKVPNVPYQPYRGELYGPLDLYDQFIIGDVYSYQKTLDARVYQHYVQHGKERPTTLLESLAQRLHDHAITDAIEELLDAQQKSVVAIMGGHGILRTDLSYRRVVEMSRALTRLGFLLASGGGPGAMEATHLGAYLAPFGDTQGESGAADQQILDEALAILSKAPSYKDALWLSAAFEVRARFPHPTQQNDHDDEKTANKTQTAQTWREKYASLAIPTWHYGHEPPNAFATHVAKYFANSVREEGLLLIAEGGVVFSPGSAGTIQEIFQDACQNHYKVTGQASPMVFFDVKYWTETKPVYPLVEKLAQGQEYATYLSITDDVQTVVRKLVAYRNQQSRK